ncbi:hypothetical protein [Thalassospira sp. TSL5-1]|uniref:hypothetical protein n=1 Tax=Thalassospira sp. TSL5-1 TaxID=1544451 RepID=UPI000AE95B75|nr:hypothetical protein [Thalassospira sp. TSL5-1]
MRHGVRDGICRDAAPPFCDDRSAVQKSLSNKYSDLPVAMGVAWQEISFAVLGPEA